MPTPVVLRSPAAWQAGDGIVASMAVDRALTIDPGYTLAQLLSEVLAGGLPPSAWTAVRGGQSGSRIRSARV